MQNIQDHLYQEAHLNPMTVEEIKVMTQRARTLPPSGDQRHVVIADGEDPWVISHEGMYYYCTVDRPKQKILVSKFAALEEMGRAEKKVVWPLDDASITGLMEIWAPELQWVDGQWYIYFALYNGQSGQERMYVLEAASHDPQKEFKLKGKLDIPSDYWAIDGSLIITESNEKYFIWSGWEGAINTSQNLYIAKMNNPYTIVSERVCISKPEYEWEKKGFPYINEGPQALIRNNKIFIIYSASGSWTDDYCLGQLTYIGGNLLDPLSWKKEPEPVFSKTDTIFGPGHASFVKKGEEDYIVYHAARSSNAGWARQVRIKKFGWKENGYPDFGKPE